MLRGIRTASTNWLGRTVMGVVMGLLAASFAVWGINDMFKGYGRSSLAKIGSTEIPVEQFRRAYQDQLQQLSQQSRQAITPEQAKAFGLDRSVLRGLINDAGLDQIARQMRLGLPNEEIVRRITENPLFRTPGGKFDRGRFDAFLRSAGLSEQRLVAEQRQLMLRRQIVDSINSDMPVPKGWLETVSEFQNQQRSIEYVTLGAAQAGEIPAPTPEQLSKFFDERKILFRAPEYRKIEVIAATPEELGRWMEIPEADIKAEYDAHRNRYVTPERRQVEQIVFPTMQEAEAAAARLKDGLSFAALAAERGLKDKDIDLGSVSKSQIVDQAVADAAFALKEGEVSAPVQGRFGAVIVSVGKIEPEVGKSLAEATPQIRGELATERAKAEVRSLHEKIEEARAGGATLPQIAEKLKLPVATYDVDRSGREPSGKVVNLPQAGQVIPAAFNSDVGVDNDPIDVDGGYVWYNVAGITPARERTLDEVEDQVEARWRDDEIASRLKAKSAELLDKLKGGAPFDAAAASAGLKVQTADKLTRTKQEAGLPPRVIAAVFRTAKDAFGSSEADQPTEWVVFRVTEIATPKFDAASPDMKRIAELIKKQETEETLEQYLAWLASDLGLSVNQAAFAQALGGSGPDAN
jgi:peptidyl-prolyl cis-trans isomerase D